MSLSSYYLKYGSHLARLHRHRHRHAYVPTSNTASHDNHEKINSWVSFFPIIIRVAYGAPLGDPLGRRSSAINDPKNSTSKLSAILFADDKHLFCSGKDLEELESIVNAQLTGVQEWLTLNQLTLNIKKIQIHHF